MDGDCSHDLALGKESNDKASSVQFSRSIVSDSLQPHEPQHARPPCSPPTTPTGGEGDDKDEIVGWDHQLNGHEFEQTLGDGEGQGSLEYCSPWYCKVLDMSEGLSNKKVNYRRPEDREQPKVSLSLEYIGNTLMKTEFLANPNTPTLA